MKIRRTSGELVTVDPARKVEDRSPGGPSPAPRRAQRTPGDDASLEDRPAAHTLEADEDRAVRARRQRTSHPRPR